METVAQAWNADGYERNGRFVAELAAAATAPLRRWSRLAAPT
jgi:hypothetical protein